MPPSPITPTTKSRVIKFNAGEALMVDDLTAIVDGATQRAWEVPGYANALSYGVAEGLVYNTVWTTPTNSAHVYTVGAGLNMAASVLDVTIGAGLFGVYAGGISPPVTLDPGMLWTWLDSAITFTLTVNAHLTQPRFDVIYVDVTEVDSDSLSRDFKDGTTGALSSVAQDKRVSVSATFGVIEGTAGAGLPVVAGADRHVVAVVRVSPASGPISWVSDATLPFGPALTASPPPGRVAVFNGADWVNDWGVLKGSVAAAYAYIPAPFAGDPMAKLLGVRINYKLAAASTCRLVELLYTAGGPLDTAIDDLPVTMDGIEHDDLIPLLGYGIGSQRGAFWGHGARAKGAVTTGGSPGLALRLNSSAGAGDFVAGVTWIWAKA